MSEKPPFSVQKTSPPLGRLVKSFSQILVKRTLTHSGKLGYLLDGILARIIELHGSANLLAVGRGSAALPAS